MVAPQVGNSEPVLVLTTVDRLDRAQAIARGLVEAKLSACVNLVPGVLSVYRWKGETTEESEFLLLIKTRRDRLDALEAWILEKHPYQVPEFLGIETITVNPAYAAWLRDATEPAGRTKG